MLEMNLGHINIFENETEYENNKGEILENDINLIGYDIEEVLASKLGLDASSFDMTLIADYSQQNGLGTGTITLSEPYTNFKALYIIYGSDSIGVHLGCQILPVEDIERILSLKITNSSGNVTTVKSFFLVSKYYYWLVNTTGMTTTSFPDYDENCVIYQIYGLR